MKSRSSFKDIQRFKELSKILGVGFNEAEYFARLYKESHRIAAKERHQLMMSEENTNSQRGGVFEKRDKQGSVSGSD